MKTLSVSLSALIVLMACCVPCTTVHAQRTSSPTVSGFTRIENVQQVAGLWSEDRHLYVKGDIGVGDRQLQDLEAWLSENGPHWTVVLMADAEGEHFLAADRRSYFGMDAVEFALGKGLSNRTGFGKLEHPESGETDGAIFVLFLKDRKFSYFSSEAQDRRGLGRSNWIGELDQPAFRAMRAGGRIVDAVKDTVQTIDQRLDRAIATEAESARQAELERIRDMQSAKESIAHLRDLLVQVDTERKTFRDQHPGATGELANPPIEEWAQQIAALENGLTLENAEQSHQPLKQLGTQIDSYLNGYAANKGYEANSIEIQKAAMSLNAPNGVAVGALKEVDLLLEAAGKKARNGDMDLSQSLRQAEEQLALGRQLRDAELRRIEAFKAKTRLVRQVLMGVGAGLMAMLTGLLYFFNRSRKPVLDRATTMLSEREASVAKETDGLDKLFSQSSDLLVSRNRIEERGYTGTTRDLSYGALNDIDDLFIMNKEIRRVLSESRALVEPKGVWDQVVNTFSRDRYDETVRRISGKPLKFTRATGIPLVLMDIVKQRALAEGKPEPTEIPDELVLTFDEIYQAIQSRRQRATDAIKTLEDSLMNVNDELNRLQSELQLALDQEKLLSDAASDGFFPIPNYFDALIPSAQSDLKEADALSATDAVSAIDGPIQRTSRKLSEAHQLAKSIQDFRAEGYLELQSISGKLRELGYPTVWIESELHQRSEWANQLFAKATSESIQVDFANWLSSVQQLLVTARDAIGLAERIRDQSTPRVDGVQREIHDARVELAQRLNTSESRVFVEPNLDPDDAVVLARRNLEAAVTMLRQGKTDACREALQGFDAEIARAVQTVEATQVSVRDFGESLGKERERLQQAIGRCSNLWGTIREIENRYNADALRLAYSSPVANDSNGAVDDESAVERAGSRASQLLQRAEEWAKNCRSMHDSAEQIFRDGMVLTAMGKLQQAATWIVQMDGRLDRVDEHLAKLEQTAINNKKGLAECISAVEQLKDYQRDRMVTVPTLEQIDALVQQMDQNHRQLAGTLEGTNPFEFTQWLQGLQKKIAELQGLVVSDRHGYAEASRALEGAVQQWQIASQYVKQARADSIPDSPTTSEGMKRVDALERNLLNVQHDFGQDHGDWQSVNRRSASLQSDLSAVSRQLNTELQQASEALESFQQASQMVYDAEHWTGPWGVRVQGSPGIRQLEGARAALQRGQYPAVLDLSRQAHQTSSTAIQRAEREVAARRMEEQQQAERIRRERAAADAARYGSVIIGGPSGSSSGPSIFGGGGGFGGGFGGGGGGGFGGGGGGSSSPSSGGADDSSGFSRSGW